jgi:hypothetical protein
MVYEISLPYSQKPSNGPYPEPNESSTNRSTLLLKIHFTIIFPPTFMSS